MWNGKNYQGVKINLYTVYKFPLYTCCAMYILQNLTIIKKYSRFWNIYWSYNINKVKKKTQWFGLSENFNTYARYQYSWDRDQLYNLLIHTKHELEGNTSEYIWYPVIKCQAPLFKCTGKILASGYTCINTVPVFTLSSSSYQQDLCLVQCHWHSN